MKILMCFCPIEKLEGTMTELYEGGADIKFILPHEMSPMGLRVTHYLILYRMPDQ